jgi:protein-S-isoprenylcysteine O-methyltransferase Ste14
MRRPNERRGLVLAVSTTSAIVTVGLSMLGWGGPAAFLAHRARVAFLVLLVLMTIVALLSPVNFSSGEREDPSSRALFLPTAVALLFLAWLMPFMDRRDLGTIDGDVARWTGVATLLGGGVLRIWPMFILGYRFSGFVAIQPGHELVTTGPYRYVRHPSYLGMMLGLVGWALVFRSSIGLVVAVFGMPLLVERIESEEALLASHFGAQYADYRRRTWRLVPGLY